MELLVLQIPHVEHDRVIEAHLADNAGTADQERDQYRQVGPGSGQRPALRGEQHRPQRRESEETNAELGQQPQTSRPRQALTTSDVASFARS